MFLHTIQNIILLCVQWCTLITCDILTSYPSTILVFFHSDYWGFSLNKTSSKCLKLYIHRSSNTKLIYHFAVVLIIQGYRGYRNVILSETSPLARNICIRPDCGCGVHWILISTNQNYFFKSTDVNYVAKTIVFKWLKIAEYTYDICYHCCSFKSYAMP